MASTVTFAASVCFGQSVSRVNTPVTFDHGISRSFSAYSMLHNKITLMLCVAHSWNAVGRQITVTGITTLTSAAPCLCRQSFTVLCRCPAVQCTGMFTAVFA